MTSKPKTRLHKCVFPTSTEETLECTTPQTRTLQEFLTSHNIQLLQITEDQKDMLDDEFTTNKVQEALDDANDVSAPGPSGHNIASFKLLFADIPHIMTRAINQIVSVPRLIEMTQFRWLNHNKVVYILKKPGPTSPSDYRPLSMLEVQNKIPSRILAKRLSKILPTVIGLHQHGFMPNWGI
jgi:hypothetical protein